ncbi:thiol-disulfide oxidoreductase DCC family protein [Camelliibacillus cellulosilyticus]|uniref:Thiol-disulfide oxidoreductase DCC family protein n=1 Tax=Camelliibacillus cellulosilyticus TaxID=2174486 RepID=A0ABV9GRH2_9BACL
MSATTTHSPDIHAIVLFDGVCNLCNKSVQFIINRDRKGYFLFSSLQSPTAKGLLDTYRIQSPSLSTIILIEKDQFYTESTAVLRICKRLNGLWKGLYLFIIVPKVVRDGVYRWIAKRRYKFFGKRDTCMVPTQENQRRFL